MGFSVDPETLRQVSDTLRSTSADVESSASEPPQPEGGELTEFFSATLSLLCERMGDLSAAAGGVGDAVADGCSDYLATDQEQVSALQPCTE